MGSRLKNSARNSFWGAFSNVLMTLLNFVVRTIFIKTLSNEYLGINGLFTNILYVLNFAELGFGNAIVYNLYKPVAKNDQERIKTLVNLYKRIYFIIGIIVLTLGLLVVPFMNYIITEPPKINENLNFIYLLYLIETVCTYFFGYKKSVLLVYQKNYLNLIISFIFSIIKSILQIFILFLTHNYILYLFIYIISTIFSDIYISLYVNKKYPFLKDKNIIKATKEERHEIFENVKSLFVYKLGNTVLNGTDNIILSMLIGINAVGLYSNYSLIITAISGVLWNILSGLTGSIGNLNVYNDKKQQENIFHEVLFMSCLLYGFGMTCISLLINPFINVWIGKEYLITQLTVIILASICYFRGIVYPTNTYRDTLGLFKEGKLIPFMSSIINIVLSFTLGILLGMKGIFLATLISILTTTFWYMPKIIYNKIFKTSVLIYFKKVLIFTIPFIISYILCINIFKFINTNLFISLILKTIIVLIVTSILFIIIEYNQQEFKELKRKCLYLIKKKG